MRERGYSPLIQGHGMALQALKVPRIESHGRGPQDALPRVLREPQVKLSYYVTVDLPGMLVAVGEGETDFGGGKPRELVFHHTNAAAFAAEAYALHERSKALLNFNEG